MTLVERCVDIREKFQFELDPSLLFKYYKNEGIRYRQVDVSVTAKLRKKEEIRKQ